jgi:hypothetical protein
VLPLTYVDLKTFKFIKRYFIIYVCNEEEYYFIDIKVGNAKEDYCTYAEAA